MGLRKRVAVCAFGLSGLVAGCSDEEPASAFETVGGDAGSTSGGLTSAETTDTTDDGAGSTDTSGTDDGTTETTDSTTDDGGDTDGDTTTGGLRLDVPMGDGDGDGDGDMESGCQKIDVVLAVDNSSSMDGVIQDIQANFNSWVQTLLTQVGTDGIDDFHIAVLDGCDESPWFHDTNDQSGACNFTTGGNYMSSAGNALATEFPCVGNTADSRYGAATKACSGDNDDENVAGAAAAAVSFPASGAQNAGFLRDDALLIVVAVTNEDEGGSECGLNPFCNVSPDPQTIYNQIVAAKGGNVENVVFVGVGPQSLCSAYGELSALPARELEEVTSLFSADNRGQFVNLCDENIGGLFTEILSTVDSACDEFVPPAG